jgi:UDP-hydrolysing UDP-N-acetyl-D-glucosamine 2-epimerase
LHGGEITEGAYDDAFRHAITKLSQLHFTSTEEYKNRLIQMGEQPHRVFNVGAIGIDNILNKKLLSKKDLEVNLGIKFKKYNYQVTFHPETLGEIDVESQFKILLEAIEKQSDVSFFVFTKSNADTDGRVINQMIDEFVSNNPSKAIAFKSLGSLNFLSLVKVCDAIIGNSSSGIIEAPSLQTQTINIGDRQKGRIQADSVINTRVEVEAISQAILNTQQEKTYIERKEILNPYGQGGVTNKIMDVLEHINFKKLRTKSFYTIKHKNG